MNKVTETQKKEMRRLSEPDEFGVRISLAEIGRRYGVTRERVRQIVGNVGKWYPTKRIAQDAQRLRERVFRTKDITQEEIAVLYGVTRTTVQKILGAKYRYEESIGARECCRCKQWLPHDRFYRCNNWYSSVCKECSNARVLEYQKTHREHVNALARQRNKTPQYKQYQREYRARRKAKP